MFKLPISNEIREFTVTPGYDLNDEKWHSVKFRHSSHEIYLTVDLKHEVLKLMKSQVITPIRGQLYMGGYR